MPTPAPLRRALLTWFAAHRRDLPWRTTQGETANAYHILLSEVMLQQTQVATVIAYFHRFIAAFPTVESLAAADEQQVLRLWQGLGYYRRARNLHAAAKVIVTDYAGIVPRDLDSLLALPGIGRYTAGAIASIAYGVRAPILDGNVMRILARLFAIQDPINAPATIKRLWSHALQLVPSKQPGDFNQAMMELGATICTPRQPDCASCPVRAICLARRRGIVAKLPIKKAKTKPTAVAHHIIAIEHAGRFLFEQRPAKGLWSHLWQLPTCESLTTTSALSAPTLNSPTPATPVPPLTAKTLAAWTAQTTSLRIKTPVEIATFTHQTTHRTITFTLWRATLSARNQPLPLKATTNSTRPTTWRALGDLDDLPLANPQRMAIEHLRGAFVGDR